MAAAKLLVTVASTWLTDESKDGEDYMLLWLEMIQKQMTEGTIAGPDGTQMDLSSRLTH